MARPNKLRTSGDFSVIAYHDVYNVCYRDGTIVYHDITSRPHAYTLRKQCQYYFDLFCNKGIC